MFSKVTVYLGSAAGNSPVYADNASELGRRLAQAGVEIVYGAGGRVTGVFPKNFKGKKESQDRRIEVRAQGLAEMVETPDLASRVAKMTELSQACIVLPGSYGTMHELFCWLLGHQLREHAKPVFILNTDGYYDCLRGLFETMASRGFMSAADAAIPCFCSTVDEIIAKVLGGE